MKKSFLFILLLSTASILFSCSDSSDNNDNSFTGEIIEVTTIKEQDDIDYIKINLESGIFKGAYMLIVNIHKEELEIDINRLKVGQKVEVITNGIIAESKPPKVLAKEIKIIENE